MKATLTKLAAWATLVLVPGLSAVGQQGAGPAAQQVPVYNYYYNETGSPQVAPTAYADGGAPVVDEDVGGGCAGCASSGGCGSCARCRRQLGAWGSVEYLMLWQKGRALPPLVTTQPNQGILPQGTILFGDDTIGNNLLSGGRVTGGLWLDSEDSLGVCVRFLASESDHTGFAAGSDGGGNPLLARPFINTAGGVPVSSALLISSPGFASGNINVTTSSDLYSGEVLGRIHLDGDHRGRLDLIGGYHTTLIDDGLTIASSNTIIGGNLPVDTRFQVVDDFNVRNEFHGGTLGLWYDAYRGPWTISVLGKLSIGTMTEQIRIRGNTVVTDPGNNSTNYPDSGLFAQRTNVGDYQRRETAFIPELNLTFNRQLTRNLDFTIGYTFIYWSTLVLAGDQIDPRVNTNQLLNGPIVAPFDPAPPAFRDTQYWLHAMTMGVNFRF
ncbi:MAG: BBP7 family outer membrane beta-barrel protein [Pirellulales bacterium]